METDFSKASAQHKLSDFDIAKAVHDRLGYAGPETAFDVTQKLVVPLLEDIGTPKLLSISLRALSPDTDNIDLEDRIKFPFERKIDKGLRPLVFTKPKSYEETGSEGNRALAKILNSLSSGMARNPIDSLKHYETGDKVLHLPKHPDIARDEERVRKKLERGEEFKADTLKLFVAELQSLLYEGKDMIGTRMQYALHRMPEVLVDGYEIQKSLAKTINDFGRVGRLIRDGQDLKDAVAIIKRTNDHGADKSHRHDKV